VCQQLAEGKADTSFIQEPWVHKGQTRALTNLGETIYFVVSQNNARFFIFVRNHINALPLLEFCSRDGTTVRIA
jgi:hypothetical protein